MTVTIYHQIYAILFVVTHLFIYVNDLFTYAQEASLSSTRIYYYEKLFKTFLVCTAIFITFNVIAFGNGIEKGIGMLKITIPTSLCISQLAALSLTNHSKFKENPKQYKVIQSLTIVITFFYIISYMVVTESIKALTNNV